MKKLIYVGAMLAYYALLILMRFLDTDLQLSVLQSFPSLSLPWARALQILLFFYPVLAVLSLLFLGQVLSNYATLVNAESDQGVRRAKLLMALSFAWIGLLLLFAGVPMTRGLADQQPEATPTSLIQRSQIQLAALR